jgi:hypothetical protein
VSTPLGKPDHRVIFLTELAENTHGEAFCRVPRGKHTAIPDCQGIAVVPLLSLLHTHNKGKITASDTLLFFYLVYLYFYLLVFSISFFFYLLL